MIPVSLQDALNTLFSQYSEVDGFPRHWCDTVTDHIKRFGLTRREGYFLVDRVMPDSAERKLNYLVEYHSWCVFQRRSIFEKGEIIDFTAHQFNPALDDPIPAGVLVIGPDHPLFKRYLPPNIDAEHYVVQD